MSLIRMVRIGISTLELPWGREICWHSTVWSLECQCLHRRWGLSGFQHLRKQTPEVSNDLYLDRLSSGDGTTLWFIFIFASVSSNRWHSVCRWKGSLKRFLWEFRNWGCGSRRVLMRRSSPEDHGLWCAQYMRCLCLLQSKEQGLLSLFKSLSAT